MSSRPQQRARARQDRQEAMGALRAQQPPQIQSAGAVDLGAMKGGDRSKQQEVAENVMRQQGFLCTCGEKFRDKGIIAMGYTLGRFPEQRMVQTPRGPQVETVVDDGCQFFAQAYCSRVCVDYLDALKNGLPTPEGSIRPSIKAIRILPTVEWMDEAQEAAA